MTTFTVQDAATLEAAFAAASDGDRIELAAGDYSAVLLSGRSFETDVIITSADAGNRATMIDQFALDNVSGVTVIGIDVEAESLAPQARYKRVLVENSSDVTLSDMEISGYIPGSGEGQKAGSRQTDRNEAIVGYGYDGAMQIQGSSDITVTGVEIWDAKTALGINTSTGLLVSGIEIHDVREGINLHDVDGVVIEESHFHDMKPWKHDNSKVLDDHPDMIQYYGTNSVSGVHNVIIRDNLFDQSGDGNVHTQTIYGSMNGATDDSVTATNFTVTGNTIINGHLNAISLYDVQGGVIADNVLLPLPSGDDDPRQVHTPGIVLKGSSADFVISGNTLLPFANAKAISANIDDLNSGVFEFTDDNILLSTDPEDPLYWRLYDLDGETDTPDDPGDETGTGLDALLQAYVDSGMARLEGTDSDDSLTASGVDTLITGAGGNDKIREKAGNDVMVGGDGADQFIFDLRKDAGPTRDVIADLDFDAGDRIRVLSNVDGAFDAAEAINGDNSLGISGDGSGIWINSDADLADLAQAGALELTAGGVSGDAGFELVFEVAQDRLLDLAFYDIA